MHIFKYIEKFNTNVPILFDDINREERHLMVKVSELLGRPYIELDKYTGYIL